jgi:hypothetical protein
MGDDEARGDLALHRQRLDGQRDDQRPELLMLGGLAHPVDPVTTLLGRRRLLHSGEHGRVGRVGEVGDTEPVPARAEEMRSLDQQLGGLPLAGQQPVVRVGQWVLLLGG